ncbi:MAG: tRNA 2-thiouridine(34) synthase MnmA [Lachnospiraceae bacterium]|nr:tRNA 2-thiouridine(34) synthase MnmA [Lachnospiraceae bacterium]
MKEKVVIGLSSGVDSSVAAFLLQEQGYEVIGATIDTGMGENAADGGIGLEAKKIAEQLQIPHYILNVRTLFEREVVRPFADAYYEARTPNPCVLCNPAVKWKALLELADSLGAQYVATGHYSRIVQLPSGRWTIEKAAVKDQSYVLYRLSQEQLGRTKMPLHAYTKDQVRRLAQEQGLLSAQKPDSQEICFIPGDDYAGFLQRYTGRESLPGSFVDGQGRVLGQHKGLIHYTIGQRKGLGIALGEPAFVSELRPQTNEVVLGRNEDCFQRGVLVEKTNFMMEEEPAECVDGLKGKIRYAHQEEDCLIRKRTEDLWECIFDQPQRAVTPGQAIVWYKDRMIYGGGQVVKGFSI